jgi:lysophospholipase L1-like esterase
MYSRKPISRDSIVLLGDSLTEGFDLDYFFPEGGLVNRGISGDTTIQVQFRIEEIVRAKPRALFLMIGINDLFHDVSPEEVTTNIINILSQFGKETRVFLQSILPVNETNLLVGTGLNTLIHAANNQLRSFCKQSDISFLDFHSHFLNHTGQMDSRYTYDGAHLTDDGYCLWADLLKPFLLRVESDKK